MSDRDVKERILEATVAILQEATEPAQITVRQIAERAGVSIGSINYNFGSKDALLADAVWQMIGVSAADWYTPDMNPDIDPVTRLRRMFKEGMRLAMNYPKNMRIGLMHVFETGNMQAKGLILPLLREIVGADKQDIELRLLAFQLVGTMELAFLNLAQLGEFLGVDLSREETIETVIDLAVDNRGQGGKEWYIEINNPRLDIAEMYIPNEKPEVKSDIKSEEKETYSVIVNGSKKPFYEREVMVPNFVCKVKILPGQHHYYFRIHSTVEMFFSLEILSNEAYLNKSVQNLKFF